MLHRSPPVQITPDDYERQVVVWLRQQHRFESFEVHRQEKIRGSGGEYTFDGVAKFTALGGAEFIVLVECKQHRRRVARDYMLTLHQKQQDVGAHKAMMFSTAGFQRGALEYAQKHGIAAVHFADGRTAWCARSVDGEEMHLPSWVSPYAGWFVRLSGPTSTSYSQIADGGLEVWLDE